MIKICIKDPEEHIDKVIPLPYVIIKKALGNASDNGKSTDAINDVLKQLKRFAKRNPGFVIVDIHESGGTTIKITI